MKGRGKVFRYGRQAEQSIIHGEKEEGEHFTSLTLILSYSHTLQICTTVSEEHYSMRGTSAFSIEIEALRLKKIASISPVEVKHFRYLSEGFLGQKLPMVSRDKTSPSITTRLLSERNSSLATFFP